MMPSLKSLCVPLKGKPGPSVPNLSVCRSKAIPILLKCKSSICPVGNRGPSVILLMEGLIFLHSLQVAMNRLVNNCSPNAKLGLNSMQIVHKYSEELSGSLKALCEWLPLENKRNLFGFAWIRIQVSMKLCCQFKILDSWLTWLTVQS